MSAPVTDPAPGWCVTRGPDAPRRRAGREWAIGETCVADLTPAELDLLRADPGYTVTEMRGGDRVQGAGFRVRKKQPRTLNPEP